MFDHHQFRDFTDEEIVEKILSGDKEYYEILVRRHNSYLYKIGRSYGFGHDDTEDLMQETYVSAYEHLADFEGRAALKTWLVKIMIHKCYRKANRLGFQNETPASDKIGNQIRYPDDRLTDGQKVVQNEELKEILEKATLQLPEDYRMVFTLRELNGLSTAETADALNISLSNVKVKLNRAKKILRKEIQKEFSPEDIFEFHLKYCDGLTHKVMHPIKSTLK